MSTEAAGDPDKHIDSEVFSIALLAIITPALQRTIDQVKNNIFMNHCTYTKTNSAGQWYYGKTSGTSDCDTSVRNRDKRHTRLNRMNRPPFNASVVEKASSGVNGFIAISGREQMLIDDHMARFNETWSMSYPQQRKLANRQRAVGKTYPLGCIYWQAAAATFPPPLAPYTGNGTCP